MSESVIALMLSVGAGAWVYNKFMNTTGNNTKTALTAAGVVGVILFIIAIVIMRSIG
jgi:hypothetical protein